jgi:hypothetical protein
MYFAHAQCQPISPQPGHPPRNFHRHPQNQSLLPKQEDVMQLLKRVGLGLMFWVGGTIGFLIVGIISGVVHGSATTRPARSIGIGAKVR